MAKILGEIVEQGVKYAAKEVFGLGAKEATQTVAKEAAQTAIRNGDELISQLPKELDLPPQITTALRQTLDDLPAVEKAVEGDRIINGFKAMQAEGEAGGPATKGMSDYLDLIRTKVDEDNLLKQKMESIPGRNPVDPETFEINQNNFTVTEENLAPGMKKANLRSERAQVLSFHEKTKAIQGDRGEGGLSTASTLGQLEGQQKGFNQSAEEKALTTPRAYVKGKGLGTKVEKIKGPSGRTRTDVLAEIARMPYKELHHIFGKAMGAKIIDNVWRLIELEKATIDDLINLNHWAKAAGMGLGDFGTEAVNRVPHSDTHTFSRKFGLEMTSEDIKAMPEFDDMDKLTSYFRELIETKVKPMRGELDLQQGAYGILPDKMRLDVEMLKVAKEDASRDLTQSYKEMYDKKMIDTPPEVKDTYRTHRWIQEQLGVTDKELIQKAKKLDEARLAQDQQMAQAKELKGSNIEDTISSAKGKQIARDEQSEWVSETPTTREGYAENYAANRIDPETTADRQMLEALTVVDDAKRQEYIDLLKSGNVQITDLVYKNPKGEWKLRSITKALRRKAEGIKPKSKRK